MIAELIHKYPNGRVKFAVKDITPAVANTLRRCVLDHVPTMAIEDVEFSKNSSVLYDEVIAHRLGLLPLRTDLKAYNLPEECSCGAVGCSKCTLKLTLKVKGPCTAYAEDLKSKDPKVKPVYPKTPITKLLKGQELELEATAILGRGKQHAKFSPGLLWYQYKPKITVNNEHPKFADFKEKFPPQVFKDNKIDKKLMEELDLVDACDSVNEEIVKVEYDSSAIVFYVEPWGQLTPKEMLTAAIDEFQTILKQFEESFDKAH